jgi:hypothetical protein
MEFLKTLDWQTLLIASIITTFIVSAINTITAKASTNLLVFVVAVVITLLNTSFVSGASFSDWQAILSSILFTMAFAVLFDNFLGKWFIDAMFGWLKQQLTDRFGKPPTPVP